MCKHHFVYPDDIPENYNLDGQTLTGWCKCGATKKSYGLHWSIPVCEEFQDQNKRIGLRVVDNLGVKW